MGMSSDRVFRSGNDGLEAIASEKLPIKKLRGRFTRPPFFVLGGKLVFLLASFLCLFLWCHGSILPSIIHGLCNAPLLQLFECIESMKNDVKRKMMMRVHAKSVLKSQIKIVRKEKNFFRPFFYSSTILSCANRRCFSCIARADCP